MPINIQYGNISDVGLLATQAGQGQAAAQRFTMGQQLVQNAQRQQQIQQDLDQRAFELQMAAASTKRATIQQPRQAPAGSNWSTMPGGGVIVSGGEPSDQQALAGEKGGASKVAALRELNRQLSAGEIDQDSFNQARLGILSGNSGLTRQVFDPTVAPRIAHMQSQDDVAQSRLGILSKGLDLRSSLEERTNYHAAMIDQAHQRLQERSAAGEDHENLLQVQGQVHAEFKMADGQEQQAEAMMKQAGGTAMADEATKARYEKLLAEAHKHRQTGLALAQRPAPLAPRGGKAAATSDEEPSEADIQHTMKLHPGVTRKMIYAAWAKKTGRKIVPDAATPADNSLPDYSGTQ